ncbi:MAG: DNA-directed RNA polymerase subunit omega [Lachnospiraceae bacterium]
MIHPSYSELMQVVNKDIEVDEPPVVKSRYSIVLATSKRARQIIDGELPLVETTDKKALSIAVEELYKGKIKILVGDAQAEQQEEADVQITQEKAEE